MKASPKRSSLYTFIVMACSLRWLMSDVLYTTGFENFTVGNDKIVGYNSWLGSTVATVGAGRSGIEAETTHGVPGLGNAGFLGGLTTPVTFAGNSLNVRRPLVLTSPNYYDPVANNKEVVVITALIGIKDSSESTLLKNRDNFELFILNGSSIVLAAVQFDNTTLGTNGSPQQLVFRTQSTTGTTALTYQGTGAYYVYDTMQLLSVRINFRTNKWSAYLDGIPLFNDLTFYSGSATPNLGAVGFRMLFGNAVKISSTNYICTGGSNYTLFDDLTVQVDPPSALAFSAASKPSSSSFSMTWNAEAAYRYSVYGTTTLSAWTLLTPTALTATLTGNLSYTDTTTAGVGKKYYRIKRVYP